MKRTDIKTLIEAMRIISEGIQSEDGVANAAIAEAGQRLKEQDDYINELEKAGGALSVCSDNLSCVSDSETLYLDTQKTIEAWNKLKESKP
jgi:predicted enzyme involved in methoxymalonyl-ACP biosynthesis